MRVTGIIEKGTDCRFSIICNEEIGNFCLGGYGDTLESAKEDFLSVIKEAQDEYVKEYGKLPKKYEDITVSYKFNLGVFFTSFDWINISKFAQEAGINESKMRQYKVGTAFASEATKNKIQKTIKRMSTELASVSL